MQEGKMSRPRAKNIHLKQHETRPGDEDKNDAACNTMSHSARPERKQQCLESYKNGDERGHSAPAGCLKIQGEPADIR